MGAGTIASADPDYVDITNLSRQLFFEEDLLHNKAVSLTRNLERHGLGRQVLLGCAMRGEEFLHRAAQGDPELFMPDIVGCFIDDTPSTIEIADFCRNVAVPEIPVVVSKISRDANVGFVFIQEPGGPCIQCQMAWGQDEHGNVCPAGSTMDIASVAASYSAWAITAVLMPERGRTWNYRSWSMSGSEEECLGWARSRAECRICNGKRVL
jgi:hypothetical protein